MEDNLKILKVEYLSNHLLDHSQSLNLSLDFQIIFLSNFKMEAIFNGGRPQKVKSELSNQLPYFYKSFKWRRPRMEDKVDYIRNHLLDHTKILNLS
jgi:hypothetical protein